MTEQSLHLGEFSLIMGEHEVDANGCTVNADGLKTEWGKSESATATLTSMMRDGDRVVGVRNGNRKPVIPVCIAGPDLGAVADTERDLARLTGKPLPLRWQPPDANAEPCVFDVVWSELEHKLDVREEARARRYFTLSLDALPFARDEHLTVTPALPVATTATTNTLRTGASTSGWSFRLDVAWWAITFSTSGGLLGVTRTVSDPTRVGQWHTFAIVLAQPENTSATPYVTLRYKQAPGSPRLTFKDGSGAYREPVNQFVSPTGWTEATFMSQGWTELEIVGSAYQYDLSSVAIQLEWIKASNRPPVRSTPRQLVRTVDVGGSARTEGSIHIDASAGTVGDCLVFTWPRTLGEFYSPVLSAYASGGTTVPDSTAASGGYRSLATAQSWLVPAHTLPSGDYQIVARLKTDAASDGTRRLRIQVKSWMGSTVIGTPKEEYVAPWLQGGLEYGLANLGEFTLPPTRVGDNGAVDIVLQRRDDETVNIYADELYALHEDGSLTMLEQYGGKHVWIDAPSLDEPKGAIWVGNAADGSDKWFASWLVGGTGSWDQHVFDPEGVNMLTVTGGCEFAKVDVTHYRRHHTHVSKALT